MNIFACSRNPRLAARYLPDKHIVKMPLESAQMLSTAAHVSKCLSSKEAARIYEPAYVNHKCNVWVRASSENASWLIEHALALCAEYTRRYHKVHASQAIIEFLNFLPSRLPSKGLLPFAQAMPEQYRQENHVLAYRNYLVNEKKHLAHWRSPAAPPSWWAPFL